MPTNKIWQTIKKIFISIENILILLVLFLIVLFPTSDIVTRLFKGTGIMSSSDYLYHLVIWFTMLGAMISSRNSQHLSLSAANTFIPKKYLSISNFITSTVTTTVLIILAFASYDNFSMVFDSSNKVGIIPSSVVISIFYIGYGIMAIRESKQKNIKLQVLSILIALLIPRLFMGLPTSLFENIFPSFMPSESLFSTLFYPALIILLISTVLGSPIFISLAGVAILLFFRSEQMLGYLPNEAYEVLTDPIFPTIPLFTIAGFILSEGKSGERLVRFFKALFGSLPGGLAIMAVMVSAFFTTFTGASGVTILALGGLLHYIMLKEKYSEDFTIGLLTSSGSIGLLFPPSLPIILYGVQAQVNIKYIFAGGIFPGLLLIGTLSVYAVIKGKPSNSTKIPFDIKELFLSFKGAIWEVLLPIIILVLYFSGKATLIETGVIAVIYMTIVNLIIHRDFTIKEFPAILLKAAPIAGAVLIILASAKGLSYYIVDAQIPSMLTVWFQENIHSKWLFLLILNIALLFTGFFMDIFSAIIVVVPLILPISRAFGIDPVHLGIIFLANLELGYLTPPVGLNLFLSALRFEKPLLSIYKSVVPFLIIMIIAVLIITYVPWLTTIGVKLFGF